MVGEGKHFDRLMVGDLQGSGRVDVDNNKKILEEKFTKSPVMSAVLGSAATATSASLMKLGDNTFLTTPVIGQTLIAPVLAATGLDIAGDQTDNDGREIDFSGAGVLGARSVHSYKIGSAAFYAKCRFSIADVSGTDLCMFGFRKASAHDADATAYTDFATLNVVAGAISISTNLNSVGISTVDTTDAWADTEIHTLEIYVSSAGVVTYKIDGIAPTVTAAVTLDTGDVFIPFFQFLQAATLCDTLILQHLECGLQ